MKLGTTRAREASKDNNATMLVGKRASAPGEAVPRLPSQTLALRGRHPRDRPVLTSLSRTCLFLEDRELGRTPVAPAIHGATGGAAATRPGRARPSGTALRSRYAKLRSFPPAPGPLTAAHPKRGREPGLSVTRRPRHPPPLTHRAGATRHDATPRHAAAHRPTGVVVLRAARPTSSRQAALRG